MFNYLQNAFPHGLSYRSTYVCCHVFCRNADRYWGLSFVSYNNVVGLYKLLMIGLSYNDAKGYSSLNGCLNVMF